MHYALKAADGFVALMQIAPGADLDEEIAKFAAVNWQPVSVTPFDPKTVPADRSYRNAWTVDGEKVTHDIVAAREVHKDKLRAERAPLLQRLDVEHLNAIGNPEKAAEVEAEKQRLRDITKDARIAQASSIEDLKKITL